LLLAELKKWIGWLFWCIGVFLNLGFSGLGTLFGCLFASLVSGGSPILRLKFNSVKIVDTKIILFISKISPLEFEAALPLGV